MGQIEMNLIDRDHLIDIRNVQIDSTLSTEEKIQSYVQQIKNPYCFKVGDVVVRVSYAENQTTLNEQFYNMLSVM